MKKRNAIRLCAILALSALILGSQGYLIGTHAAKQATASEIRKNISNSPEPTKIRILGATIFSIAILTTVVIVSREIKMSRPKKQKILSKYYRD